MIAFSITKPVAKNFAKFVKVEVARIEKCITNGLGNHPATPFMVRFCSKDS